MEIPSRVVLLHIFHHFLTLTFSRQVWAKLVTLQKPHFWSKIMGFLDNLAKNIFANFYHRTIILELQVFADFKNGKFLNLNFHIE